MKSAPLPLYRAVRVGEKPAGSVWRSLRIDWVVVEVSAVRDVSEVSLPRGG
jgi:hypothetical protein